jgi:hypothetical protein
MDVGLRDMTGYARALVALLALGCAGPVRVVHPRPCPAAGLGSERVSLELAIPHPERTFIPPMPVPTTVQRSRMIVRVVVDTSGWPMRDSVTVCGISDPMYVQRVAEEVSQMRFRPGLMHAKHVIAPTFLIYGF